MDSFRMYVSFPSDTSLAVCANTFKMPYNTITEPRTFRPRFKVVCIDYSSCIELDVRILYWLGERVRARTREHIRTARAIHIARESIACDESGCVCVRVLCWIDARRGCTAVMRSTCWDVPITYGFHTHTDAPIHIFHIYICGCVGYARDFYIIASAPSSRFICECHHSPVVLPHGMPSSHITRMRVSVFPVR